MSTRLLSAAARLNKLRAMSAAEIAHRLRYAGVLAVERRQHASGRLAPQDRLRKVLRSDLAGGGWEQRVLSSRNRNRHRFFVSIRSPEQMRSLFATTYLPEQDATAAHAARARQHRFAFFGREFEYGSQIDWQSDPVTRRAWPAVYHADVPVHGGDVGYGDVKHVWELNRQQFVIDLGKSWFLTRNDEDARAIERLVRSWIAGNPYATGVNWACALEPAFRVFSWLWTYYLAFESLEDGFHVEWLRAFYDHGRFLERHLELYSSPYNHLIAEAAALYMVGTCFPEFRDAERWRSSGRAVLEGRLTDQFYTDGGSVEQSTFYHHATIGFYLLAGVLARATGDDLSPNTWGAIERGLDFSASLVQPDGRTPSIGGADDGKPIRMEHLSFWDFRPYQAIGAVIFNRPDFKYVAGRFHEDALWLLGPAARLRFDAIKPQEPPHKSVGLRSSGYYVLRNRWSNDADYVCFDCGEQAVGMRSDSVANSMHGHADCLSVIASLKGRRVLVDSGLFAYNCGGDWEAHFRETAAHNTAKVDNRDQARHLQKMAWSHSYRASVEGFVKEGESAWVAGSHDGYARGPHGVVHRRAVWLRPDSYFLIYDEFVGTGEHEFTVNFQFAPGQLDLVGPDRARFDNAEVAWASSHAWTATSACGGASPDDGWIAPSLGVREAAPRLRLQCVSSAPHTWLLTVLAAPVVSGPQRRLEVPGHGAIVLAGDGYTDVMGARGLTPLIRTDAFMAVCRVHANGSHEIHRAGGTRAEFDPALLEALLHTVDVPIGAPR